LRDSSFYTVVKIPLIGICRYFGPILMTTMAALLGGVPMILGTGVGSELRQPLGYAIVGGLALSQILTPLYDAGRLYLPGPAADLDDGAQGRARGFRRTCPNARRVNDKALDWRFAAGTRARSGRSRRGFAICGNPRTRQGDRARSGQTSPILQ
jgi:hypothetical protein